jgi:hypothetical protein
MTLANPIVKVIIVFPKSVVPPAENCASEWRASTIQDPDAEAGETLRLGRASARIERIKRAVKGAVYLSNLFLPVSFSIAG